jgi:hypothetical protein
MPAEQTKSELDRAAAKERAGRVDKIAKGGNKYAEQKDPAVNLLEQKPQVI